MHDIAFHLVERVLPDVRIRQYVLSPPSEVVGLLAARGDALSSLGRIFVEGIFSGIQARTESERKLHCGAVVFIQRFTKTLSTYPHFHVLVLDGGYVELDDGTLEFLGDSLPTAADLSALEARIEARFTKWLQRHGYLDEDGPQQEECDAWWTSAASEPSGVLVPARTRRAPGWQVHAGVCVAASDKKAREQLCRYAVRPPFSEAQLQRVDEERVRLTFRSSLPSGQRELILHPLALMKRLAWLVPPRQHQIRYAGVLAPNAKLRPFIVPVGRVGVQRVWFGDRKFVPIEPIPYKAAWARLLARVYDVDSHACPLCHGRLKPVGAMAPPEAAEWIRSGRIDVLGGTDPPRGQLAFAM